MTRKELKILLGEYKITPKEFNELLIYINSVKEIWKFIEGSRNEYQVSNFGNVRSVDRIKQGKSRSGNVFSRIYKGRPAFCRKLENGYVYAHVIINKKPKDISIHRLVAKAFIPNPDNKRTVNHKYGNKENNMWWNLEWNTHKENINHAKDVLKVKYGERFKNRRDLDKKTIQYTLDGVKINSFSSRLEASKKTGIQRSSICDCIRGVYKTAGGYIWKNG